VTSQAPPDTDRMTRFATAIGRLIPDAMSTSIVLLVVVFAGALLMGNTLEGTADAYYRGLWMLLPFTMQMTLILVLSSTLGSTPFFRKAIVALSRLPGTASQVLALSMLTTAALAYLYWGLGVALGPVVAIFFAREAEAKGIAIDFPFLLSVTGAAGSVWQFGLSASAPLLMNTPGHFLESTVGLMPLSTTIFTPAALTFVAAFLIASFIAARLLLPRNPQPISSFPESFKLAEPMRPSEAEPMPPGRDPEQEGL
jgi:short-chain fatty acids transporter